MRIGVGLGFSIHRFPHPTHFFSSILSLRSLDYETDRQARQAQRDCPATRAQERNLPQNVRAHLHQIDLALLVREMREDEGLTQAELAKKVGTTQSVIARLEDAEYTGHSLTMLERIATACGVALKLHAEKKPNFDREVALV